MAAAVAVAVAASSIRRRSSSGGSASVVCKTYSIVPSMTGTDADNAALAHRPGSTDCLNLEDRNHGLTGFHGRGFQEGLQTSGWGLQGHGLGG